MILRTLLLFVLCLPFAFSGCGYHIAGTGTNNAIPTTVKTIAIPAFHNVTVQYKLTTYLPEALTREFISRTRYKVVNDPSQADAILTGSVLRVIPIPLTIDPTTGRTASVQIVVLMNITLRDRATNAVLFDRPNFDARQVYEIAVNPNAYFDESEVAMDRLSREVAQKVVSAILENF